MIKPIKVIKILNAFSCCDSKLEYRLHLLDNGRTRVDIFRNGVELDYKNITKELNNET